jgi:CRISPR-associated protein Cmr3
MEYWIVVPHDSVIIRDGRPFSTVAGVAKAQSLPFVTPSVMAGALRGRVATDSSGHVTAAAHDVSALQSVSIAGYMLVKRNTGTDDQATWDPYFARPADALLLKGFPQWYRVTPHAQSDQMTDLADSGLLPLQLPDHAPVAKVVDSAPFWHVSIIKAWLMASTLSSSDTSIGSIADLPRDERYHVAIDSHRGSYEAGKLFATSAIGFRYSTVSTQNANTHQMGILVLVDEQQSVQLAAETTPQNVAARLRTPPAVDTLGGEQRMVRWKAVTQQKVNYAEYLAAPPAEVIKSVRCTKNCRVLLTTPAYVADIAQPMQLCGQIGSLTVKVKAVALSRAEWHSGWDMVSRTPKYARRLLPAGTVFFIAFEGNDAESDARITEWITAKWMKPISDHTVAGSGHADQMCRDGAGIVLIGSGW